MFPYLFILFTVLPILELYLLVEVGEKIGANKTILLVIGTGFAGAFLAKYQGLRTVRKLRENLAQGVAPTDAMLSAVLILVGGVTLLTPGFITDVIGLALIFPLTRKIFAYFIKRIFRSTFVMYEYSNYTAQHRPMRPDDDGVIDITDYQKRK